MIDYSKHPILFHVQVHACARDGQFVLVKKILERIYFYNSSVK